MTRTLTPSDATRVLRDLLEALGEGADAVLTEVLAGRDVRALRVVGPLHHFGARYSLLGVMGHVDTDNAGGWRWVTEAIAGGLLSGRAPTRLAADRALCLALRELGWAPVEVPTEEAVAVEAPAAPPSSFGNPSAELPVQSEQGTPVRGLDYADLNRLIAQLRPFRREVATDNTARRLNVGNRGYIVMDASPQRDRCTHGVRTLDGTGPRGAWQRCTHHLWTATLDGTSTNTIRLSTPCADGVVFVERGRSLEDVRTVLEAWHRDSPSMLGAGELSEQPPHAEPQP